MRKEVSIDTKLPGLVYSHLEKKKIIGEQFITEHGLCCIVSGYLKAADADSTRTFVPGDILFYRKNFLSKFTKEPEKSQDFKSVTVIFDKTCLTKFSEQLGITYEKPFGSKIPVLKLESNILLENYFKTLIPYFDTSLPEHLINLKRQEALMLLLQVNPQLKNILFQFDQPDKIDLEAFMEKNFRFNVEVKRFAYLTGRSLATFKRDFEKVFHTTPNRWLQQRRLQEAHYLIKEEKKRPSDVYHEVGFETFSHFSYAFKQHYGISPSNIK